MNTIKFSTVVCSDKGKVRANNEDNFYFNGIHLTAENRDIECILTDNPSDVIQLYGVFDGMGGEALGEAASLITAETLKKYHKKILSNSNISVDSLIGKVIEESNDKICKKIIESGEKRIGTTFSGLCIQNDCATIYNIGDSRVYLLRNGKLTQISVDDTTVQRLINLGSVTKEKAKTHPDRHKLTQHLGIFSDEMIIEAHQSQAIEIKKGDKFLLCSDGLTDMVDDEDIEKLLNQKKSNKEICASLVKAALNNGGRDNITVMVITADTNSKGPYNRSAKNKGIALLCVALIAILTIGGIALSQFRKSDSQEKEQEPISLVAEKLSWFGVNDEMVVGETGTLNVSIQPAGASGKVLYSSSDPEIVSVDSQYGEYVAQKVGSVILTAKLADSDLKIEKEVSVYIPVAEITGIPRSIEMNVGDTQTLTPRVLPDNAEQKVEYSISNEKVASIDGRGNIQALNEGEADIFVTAHDLTKTVHISVKQKEAVNRAEENKNRTDNNSTGTPSVNTPKPSNAETQNRSNNKNESPVPVIEEKEPGQNNEAKNEKEIETENISGERFSDKFQ